MKITDELKDKVDKAETMKAKKDIIAEAGIELTDDELVSVAGGARQQDDGLCSCGRGLIYKNGMCKHCYMNLELK